VTGRTVCDVKVMEGFGSSFECTALRIEWAIKPVMLGTYSSVVIVAVVGCCVIILHKSKIKTF